jgi:hypothetical protein
MIEFSSHGFNDSLAPQIPEYAPLPQPIDTFGQNATLISVEWQRIHNGEREVAVIPRFAWLEELGTEGYGPEMIAYMERLLEEHGIEHGDVIQDEDGNLHVNDHTELQLLIDQRIITYQKMIEMDLF